VPRRAIVIANGDLPRESIVRRALASAQFVLAADGGANALQAMGIAPDAVIGDLDSLTVSLPDGVEIVPAPDQDRTDLDKAVGYLRERGYDDITILGATGNRLDHTFGALAVVARHAVRLIDDIGTAQSVCGPGTLRLATEPGRTVSLLPCGQVTGLTTCGLKWELTNADFHFAQRDGTSNMAMTDRVEVTVGQGIVIVYVHHET
jgi:thiamine pyrophosphokinase